MSKHKSRRDPDMAAFLVMFAIAAVMAMVGLAFIALQLATGFRY